LSVVRGIAKGAAGRSTTDNGERTTTNGERRADNGRRTTDNRFRQAVLNFGMPTRKPQVGRPASVSAFSLSRTLPPLRLPRSAAPLSPARPRPNVARPPATAPVIVACGRCKHGTEAHPTLYACDKYPYQDRPLQLCGCVRDSVEDVCSGCGHKGRRHKARRRCRFDGCNCWGFQE